MFPSSLVHQRILDEAQNPGWRKTDHVSHVKNSTLHTAYSSCPAYERGVVEAPFLEGPRSCTHAKWCVHVRHKRWLKELPLEVQSVVVPWLGHGSI